MRRDAGVSGRALLAVTGLMVSITCGAAGGVSADAWMPGVTVGMRYDNPVTGLAGTGGDWIPAVTPQLTLERLGPFTSWDVRAQRRYDSQENSGSLRRSQDVATARVTSAPAEHLRISLEGAYYRSRDLLHPDPQSQLLTSEMTRASGSAGLGVWRGEAGYRVEDVSYTKAGLDDGRAQSWNAAVFPLRSEQSQWLIGWRRSEWSLGGHQDLATSAGTVGVRHRHTPTLSSELELGVARIVDDRRASRRDELALVAGVSGFGYALGLPFDARVRVLHDVATTGVAEVWKSLAGARVGVQWERSLDVSGGVFDESTWRDFVTVEAQDTLGGGSIISLEGSYRRARPRVQSGTQIETYRAATSVSRDLRNWLRGSVRYSRAHQVAAGGTSVLDFDRNRVELSLTAVYQ